VKRLTRFNFIIDALLFLAMALIGGIGLLMKYKLVSGEERWEIYGSNPELYLLGLDRHQWGDLHLYLGYAFFGLLAFHIILHWRQIKGIFRKMVPARAWQVAWTSGFVVVSLFFLSFAFVSPIDVGPPQVGRGRIHLESGIPSQPSGERFTPSGPPRNSLREEGSFLRGRGAEIDLPQGYSGSPVEAEALTQREPAPADLPGLHEDHEERTLDINGTYTIGDVASRYGVPAGVIKSSLGISPDLPDSERLGRLRRRYGFHMSDVERVILEHREKNHINQ